MRPVMSCRGEFRGVASCVTAADRTRWTVGSARSYQVSRRGRALATSLAGALHVAVGRAAECCSGSVARGGEVLRIDRAWEDVDWAATSACENVAFTPAPEDGAISPPLADAAAVCWAGRESRCRTAMIWSTRATAAWMLMLWQIGRIRVNLTGWPPRHRPSPTPGRIAIRASSVSRSCRHRSQVPILHPPITFFGELRPCRAGC